MDVADAAELLDRRVRVVERLAVPAVLVLDGLDALALDRAGDDHGRAPFGRCSPPCRPGRSPRRRARRPRSRSSRTRARASTYTPEFPADHRLAALAEPVYVDDRGEVVELVVAPRARRPPTSSPRPSRCRRRAPRRARAVGRGTSQASAIPTPIGRPWPSDPVATSTHGMQRRRMPLEHAAELPVGEQLLVGDRTGGAKDRVDSVDAWPLEKIRRSFVGLFGVVVVVAEVVRDKDGHQVGGGHARGRMARTSRRRPGGSNRRGTAGRVRGARLDPSRSF